MFLTKSSLHTREKAEMPGMSGDEGSFWQTQIDLRRFSCISLVVLSTLSEVRATTLHCLGEGGEKFGCLRSDSQVVQCISDPPWDSSPDKNIPCSP